MDLPKKGSTEVRTRISGFKVQCTNRYTMEPCAANASTQVYLLKGHDIIKFNSHVSSH